MIKVNYTKAKQIITKYYNGINNYIGLIFMLVVIASPFVFAAAIAIRIPHFYKMKEMANQYANENSCEIATEHPISQSDNMFVYAIDCDENNSPEEKYIIIYCFKDFGCEQ